MSYQLISQFTNAPDIEEKVFGLGNQVLIYQNVSFEFANVLN